MPGNVGRLVRAGAQGVCSVLFLVFGGFILLTGIVLTASSLPLSDKQDNTVGIVGLVVLGIGAILVSVGTWLCCTIGCKGGTRGTVLQTAQGDRGQRGRRSNNSAVTTNAVTAPSQAPVGYIPPNPGTRPLSGGYMPMSPQQGYQLGPNMSMPQPYPIYPSSGAPLFTGAQPMYTQGGQPVSTVGAVPGPPMPYPPQHPPSSGTYPPSAGPYAPASGPQYPSYPYPAVSTPYYPASQPQLPPPTSQVPTSTAAENLPYNPQYLPVTSLQSSSPSAPPPEDTLARPPSYNEAMSVHKI